VALGRVTASMPALEPRRDIQGLRGIAVLLVVLAHAGVPGMAGGYLGVDVFFVLSGYLITSILLHETTTRGSLSLSTFYAKRARRILPAATLVLVTTAVVVTWLLPYVRADSVLTDVVWAALFGANIHFGRQSTDYFAEDSPVSPVQHFWSLAVEEQFYVVWPALLAILLVLGTRGAVISVVRNRVPLLRAALWVLVAVSLYWSVRQTAADPDGAYFSTATRFWELGAGALLALAGRSLPFLTVRARRLLGWGGLALVATGVVVLDEQSAVPGHVMLLPVVGTVGLLAAGVGSKPLPWSNRFLTTPPLRWLGDLSYGFYLWHWPFLVVPAAWAERELDLGTNLLLLLAALLLTWVTYHLVENPIRRARRLEARPRRALLLWPAALLCVLLAHTGSMAWIDREQAAAVEASESVDLTELPVQERVVRTGDEVHDAVADAVDRAALDAPQVSPLAQDLTEVINDRYQRDGSCVATEEQSEHELCPIGDEDADLTMVLIGDSHAQMWLSAMDVIAERAGYRLVPLIKLGCTPYDVVAWSYSRGEVFTECNDYRAWAYDQLEELDPDVVVAGSASYLRAVDPADDTLLSPEDSAPVLRDGTRSAVERWQRIAADVRLLGDVPKLPVAASECLSDTENTSADCTFDLSTTTVDGNQIVAAGAKQADVPFIDVLDMFCLEGQCPAVVGDIVVYADDDHITATYASWVADELERRLDLPTAQPD
jgi:peptidoglycan/LPS O-acetylase OafA/YrhL